MDCWNCGKGMIMREDDNTPREVRLCLHCRATHVPMPMPMDSTMLTPGGWLTNYDPGHSPVE